MRLFLGFVTDGGDPGLARSRRVGKGHFPGGVSCLEVNFHIWPSRSANSATGIESHTVSGAVA